MDETNPKDTTASPAAGANSAPGASRPAPIDEAAVDAAAATISEHIVHFAQKNPVPPAPAVPPVPVPPPAQTPPPIPPVQSPAPPPAMPSPPKPVPPIPPPPPIQAPVVPRAPIQFNVPPVPPRPITQPVPPPPPPPKPVADVPPPPAPDSSRAGGPAPVTSIEPPAQAESVEPPKKLRDDIASIINKIKLPERITLRMSGEKSKPPTPPPAPVPPTAEKEPEKTAAPRPEETPAQTPPQSGDAPKEPESPSSVASVHTLKDDLQNVVRDKKMSLVRAVALESEKKKGQEHLAIGAPSRKVIGIAIVAAILLALGLVAFVGVKSVLKQGVGNAQPATAPSLMFAEKTLPFPQETRTGIDLRRTLSAGARGIPNMSLGAIVHIVPTSSQPDADGAAAEQAMGIGEFLTAIGAQATPELIRSFRGDFFIGLHQTVEKRSPVLVIPLTSYERAFAGMLAWEPTMNADLSPIFISIPPLTTDEKGLFVERQFEDSLINNYDVRVLRDDAGAIQMMYSFPTRTMLIIAESPYSFTEVLSRLRASRQL